MMEQTEHVVNFMVQAFCANANEREKYFFRLALVNLVEMAKAEQALHIQQDLDRVHQVIAKSKTRH